MINTKVPYKIYFFDFDNTISNRDSFIYFTHFSTKSVVYFKYWISVLYLLPFCSKSNLKELFFSHFKDLKITEFDELCRNFTSKKLKKYIKKSFLNFIKSIDENSKVVVVSASINNYLKPWCDEMGFDLISTELEIEDGRLTGKFSTPNCNSIEKVKRIKKKYNLSEYDEIHVFGNSKGDLPMLELATHKYYKFFK